MRIGPPRVLTYRNMRQNQPQAASGPLRGIVFDLDGTLVDSLSTTFDAFNHALVAHGQRVHSPAEIMAYFGVGEPQMLALTEFPGGAVRTDAQLLGG